MVKRVYFGWFLLLLVGCSFEANEPRRPADPNPKGLVLTGITSIDMENADIEIKRDNQFKITIIKTNVDYTDFFKVENSTLVFKIPNTINVPKPKILLSIPFLLSIKCDNNASILFSDAYTFDKITMDVFGGSKVNFQYPVLARNVILNLDGKFSKIEMPSLNCEEDLTIYNSQSSEVKMEVLCGNYFSQCNGSFLNFGNFTFKNKAIFNADFGSKINFADINGGDLEVNLNPMSSFCGQNITTQKFKVNSDGNNPRPNADLNLMEFNSIQSSYTNLNFDGRCKFSTGVLSGKNSFIKLKGVTEFMVKSSMNLDSMDLDQKDFSVVNLKGLQIGFNAKVNIEGSDINLQGYSKNTTIISKSNSNPLLFYDLINKDLTVVQSGKTDIFIRVLDELNASILSANNISYKGIPTKITSTIRGTGRLINAN
jgi:hypothetical protein